MFGWRKRIGYIGPTVMEVVPYEFYKFAPDGVGLVGVTCNIDDWSAEWFDKALAQVAEAAKYLGSRGVDFVLHGGGPLVVARGEGFDEIIVRDIERASGVPASTGVRAAMEALRHLGAKRIAIASPYPERHNRAMADYLATHGFDIAYCRRHGCAIQTTAGGDACPTSGRLPTVCCAAPKTATRSICRARNGRRRRSSTPWSATPASRSSPIRMRVFSSPSGRSA